MRPTARSVALRALVADADAKASLDRAAFEARLDGRDRALATELVNGTSKMRRPLAWTVQRFLHRPIESLDDGLRWALLLGAYQLVYLDKLPAHAVVNEMVAAVRSMCGVGCAGLANAVLRKIAADPAAPPRPEPAEAIEVLAIYASLPDWIARHYVERFGFDRALEIADGQNRAPRRALRVNTGRWTADEARRAIRDHGFVDRAGAYGVPECIVIADSTHGDRAWLAQRLSAGDLAAQSEESQFAVHLADPRPGETVLDVCAGRGTKTALVAARLRGEGRIISIDDDESKLHALADSLEGFGLGGVATMALDARQAFPAGVPHEADVALVDVPCSGLGILGRRADARWRKNARDPARFAGVQSAILANAAACVRPGGRVLYVTCSTTGIEDERVVETFLAASSQWAARSIDPPKDIAALQLGPFLLTIPGVDGNDGFFYAMLERRLADG